MNSKQTMTERQQRELEYHKQYAESHKDLLERPFSFDIVLMKKRKWWNAHWAMYTYLLSKDLTGKTVLVIGCGFGGDALYLAKAGANVKAFDLSPESLSIARKLADREQLKIDFQEMPAENLSYDDDYFDIVVATDILHHVDIPASISEILRTSKPGGIFCFNEIYTHSLADKIRHSTIVEKWLYPKMVNFVYESEKLYITDDERKLTEKDIRLFLSSMLKPEISKYFYFLVARIFPKKYLTLNKIDRLMLILMSPIAHILGGRVVIGGMLKN